MYAGATAGNGISAAAGLGGETGAEGGIGKAAAGASAGGIFRGVEKTTGLRHSISSDAEINSIPKEPVLVERVRPRWSKFFRTEIDEPSKELVFL